MVECSPDRDPELWSAARVGLGALGVLSTVTLQTVPAFRLHTVEEPMRMDRILADLDALVDGNDHFGLFWFPGSDVALAKRSNRTDEPVRPRLPRSAWVNDVLVDNHLFGVACKVATQVPAVGRAIVAGAGNKARHEWVDRSDRVFATPRLVRVVEMEYSIPREAFPEAFERLRRLVAGLGPITVPVEIRWTAGDDIPLSHASGRDSAYIAVHMYRGVPYDQYFQGVETIMADHEGRPHWGKLHFQSAETLAPRYPRWDEFQAVRATHGSRGSVPQPVHRPGAGRAGRGDAMSSLGRRARRVGRRTAVRARPLAHPARAVPPTARGGGRPARVAQARRLLGTGGRWQQDPQARVPARPCDSRTAAPA